MNIWPNLTCTILKLYYKCRCFINSKFIFTFVISKKVSRINKINSVVGKYFLDLLTVKHAYFFCLSLVFVCWFCFFPVYYLCNISTKNWMSISTFFVHKSDQTKNKALLRTKDIIDVWWVFLTIQIHFFHYKTKISFVLWEQLFWCTQISSSPF